MQLFNIKYLVEELAASSGHHSLLIVTKDQRLKPIQQDAHWLLCNNGV